MIRRLAAWSLPMLFSISVEGSELPTREYSGQPGPIALPAPRADLDRKLDLRLGNIRRYVPEQLWASPLPGEMEAVEVVGRPGTPDMAETRPVPGGLGGLWWAVRRPGQAWRLLLPDPNGTDDSPSESR